MRSSHDYTQLTDEAGLEHRESAEPAAPPGSDTARALQPVFAALQQRLKDAAAARPLGAGVTVSITVGREGAAERWLVDAREGVAPDAVIVRKPMGAADDAVVRIVVPEPADLLALLERRLPPFRALAQRRLVLRGDLAQLRSMQWLFGGGVSEGGEGESSAVCVRVLHADASKGHGEYVLSVEEGAVSWLIARRWSELKALSAELSLLYGRGSGTLELQLPTVPTSYRSSTSATLLKERSRQMTEHLAALLRLLHCSPRNGDGPPVLLRFLRPTDEDSRLATAALPRHAHAVAAAGHVAVEGHVAVGGHVAVPPPTALKGGGGEANDVPRGLPPSPTKASARKEIPMAELLLRRRMELAEASVLELGRRAERMNAWAGRLGWLAALVCLFSLVYVNVTVYVNLANGGAWLSVPRGPRDFAAALVGSTNTTVAASSSPAAVADAVLVPSTGAVGRPVGAGLLLLGVLLSALCFCRRQMDHEKASLYWRYVAVFTLFWRVYLHYRWARVRAHRVALATALAEGRAFDGQSHLEEGEDASDAVRELWEEAHDGAGKILFHHMSELGGLWVKTGQYLASRADMVPKELGRHLAAMLDSNKPRPLAEVVTTLLDELGEAKLAKIASFDPIPISTASIAQVHLATLGDGRRIVLKLQHVEVREKMTQDLVQAEALADTLYWLEPQLDLKPMMTEMHQLHLSELDFTAEATNLREVGANLARRRIRATIPTVIDELSTRRCLAMGLCEGHSLKDAQQLKSLGIDCALLVARVCEAWAVQMFADGVFNCDPHPGNLLVRPDPSLGPVPVLLDFGLCKRLSLEHKLAFCRMVVALSYLDADGLVGSLETLGLQFPPDIEPFTLMKGLAFTFRDTEADAGQARSRIRTRLKKARADRQKIVEKRKEREEAARRAGKPVKPQQQVPTLPGVVAYFYRTLMMLQGLATNLGVSLSFMPILSGWAAKTLLEHRRAQLQPSAPLRSPPPSAPPRSALQERALRLLHALADTDELLGAQVSLVRRGVVLVDAAVGRLGAVDPRPVRTNSLFQLFEAGSPVLATIALQQAVTRGGALWLQTPLANLWPPFAQNGKEKLTLLHLLSHQTGLQHAYPADASLNDLIDTGAMVAHVASAPMTAPGAPTGGSSADGGGMRYEGLPWGCGLWGVLQACTGQPLPALLLGRICAPLGLPVEPEAAELLLSVPSSPAAAAAACEARVVTHDASALLKRAGLDLSEVLTTASAPEDEGDGPSDADVEAGVASTPGGNGSKGSSDGGGCGGGGGGGGGGGMMMMMGPQVLLAPHFLNMQKLRTATLPGVSMHGTARALAVFYDGVGSAKLLPTEVVSELPRLASFVARGHTATPASPASARTNPSPVKSPPLPAVSGGASNAKGVRWAAGFQLGEAAVEMPVTGEKLLVSVLGHGAVGGSVGFVVPAAGLALAVTVSKLAPHRRASQRLIEMLLDEFGVRLTRSEGLLHDA